MEPKINITTEKGELIIREGKAAEIHQPVPLGLIGTITAPADFYLNRKEVIDPIKLKCHVIANYTKREISLNVNESDKFSDKITGELRIHPDLENLKINQVKNYSEKELQKVLNFYGVYFKEKEAHTDLMRKLKDFKATVEKNFVNANDYRGAEAHSKITKITHDMPLGFTLNIPIFTGMPVVSFSVEICVSAQNDGVIFWLESVGLHELMQKETEKIFKEQLSKFGDIYIISQW